MELNSRIKFWAGIAPKRPPAIEPGNPESESEKGTEGDRFSRTEHSASGQPLQLFNCPHVLNPLLPRAAGAKGRHMHHYFHYCVFAEAPSETLGSFEDVKIFHLASRSRPLPTSAIDE